MRKTNKLPLNELREVLTYDADTGILYWTEKAFRKHNKPAGYLGPDGYIHINTLGHKWKAHRVAYALHTGQDPWPLEIDHINRNRSDNRACNLRAVATSVNNTNRPQEGNKRNSRSVALSYPDGGQVVARSIKIAAWLTNTSDRILRHALHRQHHRVGGTGIHIAYH
jgi:hypothetical protein